MNQKIKVRLVIALVILQIFILWIAIFKFEFVLKTGQEIIVKTQIRDPRDLFRGQYVFISYADGIQTYSGTKMDEICTWDSYNKKIYVVPKLSWNDFVQIENIFLQQPNSWTFIKAKITYCDIFYPELIWPELTWQEQFSKPVLNNGFRQLMVQYPQDRFFIHEWANKPIEDAIRSWNVYAVWKLSKNWNTVLSHLLLDSEIIR